MKRFRTEAYYRCLLVSTLDFALVTLFKMPHSIQTPDTIQAYVNYHDPPPKGEEYPVQYVVQVGFQRRKQDRQLVNVTDIRTCDDEFNVDKQGFQVVKTTITEKAWEGDYRFGLPPQIHREVQELIIKQ